MHIEGTANYHNIFEPSYLQVESADGHQISFQPSDITRGFLHQLSDLPDLDTIQSYRFSSGDGSISFYYMIHPAMGAIVIPPNSIEMEHTQKNRGISDMIQRFFEMMAHKHGYRLIVGITPQSAAAFGQRVFKILRNIGYYMGPPSEQAEIYFGEHQSTYMGMGFQKYEQNPNTGCHQRYNSPYSKNIIK